MRDEANTTYSIRVILEVVDKMHGRVTLISVKVFLKVNCVYLHCDP